MQSIFEKNGGTYRREEDYLIPNIELSKRSGTIGKYGRLHKQFIKENYPVFYSALILNGKPFDSLQEIDSKARNEVDMIIISLAERQGVTEQLKVENQLEWVDLMNNIKARSEEV